MIKVPEETREWGSVTWGFASPGLHLALKQVVRRERLEKERLNSEGEQLWVCPYVPLTQRSANFFYKRPDTKSFWLYWPQGLCYNYSGLHGQSKSSYIQYLRGSLVAQMVKNLPVMWEIPGFDPWVGKIPLEEGMTTYSSILAWRIPWTKEPGPIQVYGVTKSQTWLSDFHFHNT